MLRRNRFSWSSYVCLLSLLCMVGTVPSYCWILDNFENWFLWRCSWKSRLALKIGWEGMFLLPLGIIRFYCIHRKLNSKLAFAIQRTVKAVRLCMRNFRIENKCNTHNLIVPFLCEDCPPEQKEMTMKLCTHIIDSRPASGDLKCVNNSWSRNHQRYTKNRRKIVRREDSKAFRSFAALEARW